MSLSPSPVSLSNDTSTPRSRDDLRASTVEAIVAVIDIPALFGDGSSPVNASEVERGLKDLMNDSCRAAMGEYIEGLDDGGPTLLRDGENWTRCPEDAQYHHDIVWPGDLCAASVSSCRQSIPGSGRRAARACEGLLHGAGRRTGGYSFTASFRRTRAAICAAVSAA